MITVNILLHTEQFRQKSDEKPNSLVCSKVFIKINFLYQLLELLQKNGILIWGMKTLIVDISSI